jgi:hypothetical protein
MVTLILQAVAKGGEFRSFLPFASWKCPFFGIFSANQMAFSYKIKYF